MHQPSNTITKNMKRIILCIVLFVTLLLLVPANVALQKYRLNHLDHKQLLAACRQAIADRSSYRNDKDKWGTLHEDDVLLLSPIQNEVPQVLRDLHPTDILIRDDSVLITLNVPLARVCIVGFNPGVRQYDTSQYVDGLWFWNGNDVTKQPARK
jgi:hypothetical protein